MSVVAQVQAMMEPVEVSWNWWRQEWSQSRCRGTSGGDDGANGGVVELVEAMMEPVDVLVEIVVEMMEGGKEEEKRRRRTRNRTM